jgi:hypothetical protein
MRVVTFLRRRFWNCNNTRTQKANTKKEIFGALRVLAHHSAWGCILDRKTVVKQCMIIVIAPNFFFYLCCSNCAQRCIFSADCARLAASAFFDALRAFLSQYNIFVWWCYCYLFFVRGCLCENRKRSYNTCNKSNIDRVQKSVLVLVLVCALKRHSSIRSIRARSTFVRLLSPLYPTRGVQCIISRIS